VLAFAGGAVAEVVRNGINGWICEDIEEMANRIRQPLPLASACRAVVAESFAVDRMAERYLDVYQQAIAGEAASLSAQVEA
jgi:glycosyltransferase involved in cell wall biosynthesis